MMACKKNNISEQMPQISIIVPVYNSDKCLRRCINSVLSQSFRAWELLLVDDGSTDGSGRICDEYVEKDKRIHVKHKTNSGVSDTRNVGIDIAKGEWIFFLDSDDEIYEDTLTTMVKWSVGADLVVGTFKNVYVGQPELNRGNYNYIKKISKIISKKRFVRNFDSQSYKLPETVFPKLFSTDLIRKHCLKFDSSLYYAEDQLFLADYIALPEVEKVYVNNTKFLYKYYINPQSAMGKYNVFSDKVFTDFVGFCRILDVYRKAFNDKLITRWAALNAYSSGMHILRIMQNSNISTPEQRKYVESKLSEIKNLDNNSIIVRKYETKQKINEIKVICGEMSRKNKISYINDWLRSDKCVFRFLNRRWKLLYLLSLILGKLGVSLVIDKITFDKNAIV